MRRAVRLSRAVVLILGCLAASACDVPFEPFAEDDRNLSVFGVLDVSADTQWVRVTPVRRSVLTTPGPIDVTVKLEDLTSGRVVELRDSIVTFEGGTVDEAEDLFTHNFWTTEPIEPGATYAVTVTGADGSIVGTTVPIPEDFGVTVVYPAFQPGVADVRTETVEYLGFVWFRRHMPPGCEGWPGPPWYHVVSSSVLPLTMGLYNAEVSSALGFRDRDFPCDIVKEDLLVVASGASWPTGRQNATSSLGTPEASQNIENGFGFLGGVLTKPIPWEPCRVESAFNRACVLVYDSTSVTLEGTVTDGPTGVGLSGVELRLTEILPDGSETKYRGVTDGYGSFELGALMPGVSYVFRLNPTLQCPPGFEEAPPAYLDRVDTIPAYGDGERATANAVLERNSPPCPDVFYVRLTEPCLFTLSGCPDEEASSALTSPGRPQGLNGGE